jgi:hypothetical protein
VQKILEMPNFLATRFVWLVLAGLKLFSFVAHSLTFFYVVAYSAKKMSFLQVFFNVVAYSAKNF